MVEKKRPHAVMFSNQLLNEIIIASSGLPREQSRERPADVLPSPLAIDNGVDNQDVTEVIDDSLDQEQALLQSDQDDAGSSDGEVHSTHDGDVEMQDLTGDTEPQLNDVAQLYEEQ